MNASITVQNLKCGGCAASIKKRLDAQDGIFNVEIATDDALVSFTYDTLNDLAIAENNLIDMGYPPEGIENTFKNKAVSMLSCATGKFTSS